MCQILDVTRGIVSDTWQGTCQVPTYVYLFQFSTHICLFVSI